MKTKEEALTHCNDILNAFAAGLGVLAPCVVRDELWGSSCIDGIEYLGHRIGFCPFYRHQEQKGGFSWDETSPDWETLWENGIEIVYGVGELDHPDCPDCDCSREVSRRVKNNEEAADFAAEIRAGKGLEAL